MIWYLSIAPLNVKPPHIPSKSNLGQCLCIAQSQRGYFTRLAIIQLMRSVFVQSLVVIWYFFIAPLNVKLPHIPSKSNLGQCLCFAQSQRGYFIRLRETMNSQKWKKIASHFY